MCDAKSAYIHIPFCVRKCPYCDFVSFEKKEFLKERYIRALCREIRLTAEQSPGGPLSTIYFGGGTPSLLLPAEAKTVLEQISDSFGIETDAEITIEVNPGTVCEETVCGYKAVGFNRISVGIQSFSNRLLKSIGRIHSAKQAIRAVEIAREAGFRNISCDLMLGIPDQMLSDLEGSVRWLIRNQIPHVSCYSLSIEEGTDFFMRYADHPESLPSDEKEREMYHKVRMLLTENGYRHYEISNFAYPGYESRHNSVYWDALPYYGFGCAAHSYIGGWRNGNVILLDNYIEALEMPENNLRSIRAQSEFIDREGGMKEYMLLGFRRLSGVLTREFNARFQVR
ncbi:MAG: radical SAM family heme chaperone HemW, partial [Clostridiales bacterium]|nr:radical SAM family heme chaperone HemW [Clostridiales bacterium]